MSVPLVSVPLGSVPLVLVPLGSSRGLQRPVSLRSLGVGNIIVMEGRRMEDGGLGALIRS